MVVIPSNAPWIRATNGCKVLQLVMEGVLLAACSASEHAQSQVPDRPSCSAMRAANVRLCMGNSRSQRPP